MRYFTSPVRLALVAGALLGTVPAFAQQAAPPTPPVAPAPNPVAHMTVTVGDGTTPAPDSSLTPDLVIPAPPGGKLRVEMDARSEDILGVMKSFLKGIGETGERNPPAVPGQPAPAPNSIADLLANGSLADIYKDVNHVHFVVYELPAPATPPGVEVMPSPGRGVIKPMPLVTMPPMNVPSTPAFDSNAFYESAFDAEGAHRIMFADAGDYKLVMVGFPDRKGYAFAVSGAGYLAVSRTDGYPNLEVLSAFISRATSQAMNSKMVKDAINKGMNSDKLLGGDKILGSKLK